MKNKGILIGIGVIVLIIIIWVTTFNSLQTADENVDSKWAQVENQLKRRYDLIPNLIETVKGYTTYESSTLEAITAARSASQSATNLSQLADANAQLTSSLGKLSVVVEAYPELKANEQFQSLMTELAGTENRIAVARMDYNNAVQSLNKKIRTFPSSLIAGMSGVEKRDYFDISQAEAENPTVNFSY